ncbi:phosphatidylinositol transfer protein csr1 [Coemansia javaensis]|uniref:Phosphatidylinositol transfer protein csr1 n=1 Tax=Coemansia javaensis TaxID=2761396 RepID=A0A9W8HDQ2_9FUNG|nr:phosphatidylinositol transfer protein csr1 [Coemansia javaensis]
MDPVLNSLLDHYRHRVPLVSGHVGSLTDDETRKLREMWHMLLDDLGRNEPFPVLCSGGGRDDGDVTALTFEPLSSLNIKDNKDRAQQYASDTESQASVKSTTSIRSGIKGSWLGGWLGAGSSGRNTPSSTRSSPENSIEDRRRTETVQEYVTRMRASGSDDSGEATAAAEDERLVPSEFRSLFGDSAGERSFRTLFWQAATQIGDPDSWVLRFLRARKWDVPSAYDMIRKTLEWRAAQAIDEVVFFGESQLHHHTMDSGLSFACTVDRLGNPVYIVRVRVNVARNRNIQAIKRFLCWQIETSQMLSAGPADGRVTMLFDLSDFTRENIDIKLLRTLISLLTNYYPETLGIVLVYVNSLLFSSLWTMIAPFIDPNVRTKIIMAKTTAELTPFIDPEHLPVDLGGDKEFTYQYAPPTSAENSCMTDAAARDAAEAHYGKAVDAYTRATREWLDEGNSSNNNSNAAAAAAGDDDTTTTSDADTLDPGACGRDTARGALHKATIALDPYIRARTLYHRTGVIKSDRTVSF